jgi:hypothetical protein
MNPELDTFHKELRLAGVDVGWSPSSGLAHVIREGPFPRDLFYTKGRGSDWTVWLRIAQSDGRFSINSLSYDTVDELIEFVSKWVRGEEWT